MQSQQQKTVVVEISGSGPAHYLAHVSTENVLELVY